jgi:hypothetical protein
MPPSDPRLYERVKREAKARFERWPSAYGSAWLVREYKRRGGRFSSVGPRSTKKTGVGRWMEEEWVQVVPYVTSGRIVRCGERRGASKACRPLRRRSKATPLTVGELVRRHGKDKVLRMASRKARDMDGRLHWGSGSFRRSRKQSRKK